MEKTVLYNQFKKKSDDGPNPNTLNQVPMKYSILVKHGGSIIKLISSDLALTADRKWCMTRELSRRYFLK